jgi:hypothetical protein
MIELFKLWPGSDHFFPHEDQDALTFNELDHIYGTGLADRDLTNVEYMPLRLTGTPVGRTDLLLGPSPFLVMSWRLLRLLESLGDFPHQAIPAYLMPDRDDWQDHPPIDTTSFVVCNLHQHLHVIDFARCELEPIERAPGVSTIKRLTLVDGVAVPPLFRQDNWQTRALIPRSTRDAILAAGMLDISMPPVHGGVIHLDDIKPSHGDP